MNHTYKMDRYLRVVRCLIVGLVLVLSFSLLPAMPVRAAAIATGGSGNWNSTTPNAPWVGGVVPVAGDTVTIASGHTVTIPSGYAAAAASIAINNAGAATGITFTDATSSLTLTGALTMNAPSAGSASTPSTVAVGAGTLSAASITITAGGNANRISQVTVSTGTLDVTGGITFGGTAGGAKFTFTDAGRLNVGGNFGSAGTLATVAGSVINFNGGAAQTIGTYTTYNNVEINNTSGGVTILGATTFGGTLTVTTGTFTVGAFALTVTGATSVSGTLAISSATGTKTFTGDVTINSGGVWNETAAAAVIFSGNFANDAATFTASTGTHTFNGAGKTLSGATATVIPTVTFATGAGPINNGTLTVGTLLTVTTVALTNNGVITATTALAGTGTMTNAAAGTLNLAGTCSITTLANAGIINRTGTGTTTTALANFTNTGTINISGSGTITGITNNAAGIVNHSGSSTITSFNNATSTSTLNISTTPTVPTITTLTVTVAGNTVNYSGAGAQTVKDVAYGGNLGISGSGTKTWTLGAARIVTGNLNIGDDSTLSVAGAFAFTVTGTTTVGGGTSGTLSITNATGTKTFTGAVTINSGADITETAAAALTFSSDVTITGTLAESGAAVVGIAGSLVNNGTLTAGTGTHTFSGATKTISGASPISIPTVTFTGAYTNSGNLTVATLLTVTTVTLTNNGIITATAALAGTGTLANGASGTLNLGGTCSITTLANAGTATITGSGAISTVLANFTNTGTLNLSGSGTIAGITNNAAGIVNLASSGTITSFNNATSTSTLNISTTPTVPTFTTLTATAAGNTVDYSGAGTQTVMATTYVNLTLSGTSAKTFPAGTTTVNGILSMQGTSSVTITGTLVLNADLTNSSGGTITGTGAVTIGGTATQSIAGFTTTGTVSMTKTLGTATFTGNVSGAGFTLSGLGGTLDLGASFTHTFSGTWTRTNGTLLGNSSTLKLGAGFSGATGTFTAGSGTVEWNAAGPQTIATVSYNNLTLSGSGAKTTTGATVNGILSMEGTATTTGTVATYGAAATLQYKGSGAQTTGTEFSSPFDGTGGVIIDNAGGVNLNGSVAITNGLTLTSGAFAVGAFTLTLNGLTIAGTPANLSTTSSSSLVFGGSSSGVNIPGSVTALNNLTINNSNGVTLNSSPTISGTLTLTSGTFPVAGNTLTLNGPTIGGTPANLSTTSSSSLVFGGSSAGVNIPSSVTALNNLTLNNSNGVTLNSSPTISGTLTLTSGTFPVAGNTLTLNGPTIAGTPANLSTTSSSSLVFGGSSSGVNIPGSVTALNNLTLNNAGGLTLNSSPTISGTLTLTSGNITTGSNTLNIAELGSISGGGAATYVNGNLGKAFGTGAGQSFTFPVGDTSNYTPVAIAGMTVSTAGSLTANTTAGDHPNISASDIDFSKSANRYWTLTAVGGLVVSTYNGTFTYVSADVDAGANTTAFVVRKYSGSWSAPAGGSVAGATYTTGNGFTAFGDFAVGALYNPPSVTAVVLYQADRATTVTAMTPQVEYAVKVSVANDATIGQLTNVVVTIYYDSGGTYVPANRPGSGNTQTAAIMTDNVSGSPSWGIDLSANTTWSIISGNSTQPSLGGTSGDFWFHFKPGKVATTTTGNATGKWYIYARATGPYGFGDNHQDDRTMNWYGEIIVNTANVDFGNPALGSNFTANSQTGISVTYISNGPYSMQVKLSSPWTDGGVKMITLNASGSPGAGEFSIKAHSTAVYASAVVVTTNYVTVGAGTQTGDIIGVTVNTHTLWLQLGALGIPAVQYTGTVYYGIAP